MRENGKVTIGELAEDEHLHVRQDEGQGQDIRVALRRDN